MNLISLKIEWRKVYKMGLTYIEGAHELIHFSFFACFGREWLSWRSILFVTNPHTPTDDEGDEN